MFDPDSLDVHVNTKGISSQLQKCFVTDGACMTSTGNQSPSILYMALTARAANFAISELKKGNL
jgi:hypothetical protein